MIRLLSLAIRNVLRNRRRSSLTLLAVFVGVVMVILLRAYSAGFSAVMVQDVVEVRSGAIQVHRAGYTASLESNPLDALLPYTDQIRERLLQVKGVRGVTGRIVFNGLVSNGSAQTLFVGKAIDVEHERDTCPRYLAGVKLGGEHLKVGDVASAVIGYELAQSFQGDLPPEQLKSVTLQSSSPQGRANALDVVVKGLSTTLLPFENKRVVTIPLTDAQALVGIEGQVTEYALRVDDLERVEEIAGRVRQELGEGYEVLTWRESQPFVRDVINRQNVVLGIIAFALFVVVLTGIINTMLMSVFERVREIGTMMAFGVRRTQLITLFLMESIVLGLMGATGGALVGRTAVEIISRRGIVLNLAGTSGTSIVRPFVTPTFMVAALLVATLGALVAGVWPAWKASQLKPVDALRST